MPLVFGLAPVVNTFVTMTMAGTFKQAKPIFFVGIVLAALGAAGVLRYKPAKPKVTQPEKTAAMQIEITDSITPVSLQVDSEAADAQTESTEKAAEVVKDDTSKKTEPNLFLAACCIGMTALCWGAYGPVLHSGQAKMQGSRLRPGLLCHRSDRTDNAHGHF